MPGKNLEKIYLEHSFYHVYNRGVNKQAVFLDNEDYAVFLNLFKRYLSDEPVNDNKGREYPWLHNDIELLAFCLMPNHFHALIYQIDPEAMTKLLKAITTTYSMYFNKKYKRLGPLFQNRFRAVLVMNDSYLDHISRYIHLNPKHYKEWPYSSLPFYLGNQSASWLQPKRVLGLFDNSPELYAEFVADYESHKAMLDELKAELAD
jgi:putative transposase